MDLLRISATSHGINYLPEYLASRTGMFARRALAVESVARDPWTGTLEDLEAGRADLVLGGIWVPAMYAGRGRALVAVGQLNNRFGKSIVTRRPVAGFDWAWLEGRTVLAPGAGGTAPYEYTAGVMRQAGADPSRTTFVRDLSGEMLGELFAGGLGDALIADALTATRMTLAGTGHIAHTVGADVVMPNSVYYTYRDRLDDVHDRAVALMAGVQEAMDALVAGADPGEVIAAEWPDGDSDALGQTAARLAADGTWSGTRIEAAGLERWLAILRDAGLVTTDTGHADLVDASVVEAAMAAEASR